MQNNIVSCHHPTFQHFFLIPLWCDHGCLGQVFFLAIDVYIGLVPGQWHGEEPLLQVVIAGNGLMNNSTPQTTACKDAMKCKGRLTQRSAVQLAAYDVIYSCITVALQMKDTIVGDTSKDMKLLACCLHLMLQQVMCCDGRLTESERTSRNFRRSSLLCFDHQTLS